MKIKLTPTTEEALRKVLMQDLIEVLKRQQIKAQVTIRTSIKFFWELRGLGMTEEDAAVEVLGTTTNDQDQLLLGLDTYLKAAEEHLPTERRIEAMVMVAMTKPVKKKKHKKLWRSLFNGAKEICVDLKNELKGGGEKC